MDDWACAVPVESGARNASDSTAALKHGERHLIGLLAFSFRGYFSWFRAELTCGLCIYYKEELPETSSTKVQYLAALDLEMKSSFTFGPSHTSTLLVAKDRHVGDIQRPRNIPACSGGQLVPDFSISRCTIAVMSWGLWRFLTTNHPCFRG